MAILHFALVALFAAILSACSADHVAPLANREEPGAPPAVQEDPREREATPPVADTPAEPETSDVENRWKNFWYRFSVRNYSSSAEVTEDDVETRKTLLRPGVLAESARRAPLHKDFDFLADLHEDMGHLKEVDPDGNRLMHWMMKEDLVYSMRELSRLRLLDGMNVPNAKGELPLHLAESVEMAQLLWNAKDAAATDSAGRTPLMRFADLVRDSGPGVFAAEQVCASGGWKAFWIGSNPINGTDREKRTALHYAARHTHLLLIDTILNCDGVNWSAKDKYLRTPLHYAAAGLRRSGSATYALLNFNREKNRMAALRQGFIDAQDENGDTALHIAVRCQSTQAIAILQYFGASTSLKNRAGETALDQKNEDCPE